MLQLSRAHVCGSTTVDVKSSSVPVSPASEPSSSPDSAPAAGSSHNSSPSCRPLYQSATVDVYARFVMADIRHGSPPYMLHRKALFRLTDLLRDRIRLSDESVARLRGGTVVDGLKPGVTEIQVCQLHFTYNPSLLDPSCQRVLTVRCHHDRSAAQICRQA